MTATVVIDMVGKDNFSSTLGNFGNILTGIKSAVDLVGDAFRAFSGFAMEGIEAIASYERIGLSFESLVASQLMLSGAAKDMASAYDLAGVKAELLLKWSQDLAIHSPFTQEGVALALRQAMAYGFNADEAMRLTDALVNFAAGSGASEEVMRRIALALGQMQQTGRVLGQDLNQLSQAGLPVIEILADHFGVTTQRIMEMKEQGLIPAQEAIEAFTNYMEDNFAGAAERQAISWAGLMSTFEDLKQMGLREFFGGLAEAIHPLVVSFSEWVQGPGLIFLGTLGDILGKLATETLGKLSEFAPVFKEINESLLLFSGLIQIGLTPLEAFREVLEKLSDAWDGTALGNFIDRLREFIDTADTEGIGQAFKDLFADIFSNFDLRTTVQTLLNKMADALSASDHGPIGNAIAAIINESFLAVFQGLHIIINEVDWAPFGNALGRAIGQIWDGMVTDESNRKVELLANAVGEALMEGLLKGMASIPVPTVFLANLIRDYIVEPVKRLLGIASPSTVFMQIGKDIVLGLIAGITSMAGTLLNMISGIVEIILAPLQPILDLLGIGDTTSTGTTGGRSTGTAPGSPTTGTTTLPIGGGVVNNFYGNVYFGDMGQLGYDCPSPHPLMTASSQSILTSGLE